MENSVGNKDAGYNILDHNFHLFEMYCTAIEFIVFNSPPLGTENGKLSMAFYPNDQTEVHSDSTYKRLIMVDKVVKTCLYEYIPHSSTCACAIGQLTKGRSKEDKESLELQPLSAMALEIDFN
ncbi:hypothetical protein HAX54_031457 [Datura stramonium]|uniref:Uncharacterized protein n=1 Tax=Datura stramonium TaxID=4076 RepID=A0ABS8SC78_DATST|nr:hypothetical protein [Datura stramonium]